MFDWEEDDVDDNDDSRYDKKESEMVYLPKKRFKRFIKNEEI